MSRLLLRLLVLLLVAESQLLAQNAALVRDIQAVHLSPSSVPGSFRTVGGLTFFVARTKATGPELYVTTATPEVPGSTRLVRDILPGAQGSDPQELTAMGGVLYFSCDDGAHGRELWRSDGSGAGTYMVDDIAALADSNPRDIVAGTGLLTGKIFFSASEALHGRELWSSDGTAAGTILLLDISPGSVDGFPSFLVAAGNRIYFAAEEPNAGRELWVSDGTGAGTRLVLDLAAGSKGSYPIDLTALGSRVVFIADDGSAGYEPWISDGSAAGTYLLGDISPGSSPSYIHGLTTVGAATYFIAQYNDLYRTDGTRAGTILVTTGVGSVIETAALGQLLVFTSVVANGSALWRSDGTAGGTAPISAGWANYALTELKAFGNTLYFQGTTTSTANQGSLYKSDGTAAGTGVVTRIRSGSIDAGPVDFELAANGRVVFSADDGTHEREPWVSDGTASGTKLLLDIEFDPVRTHSSSPYPMTEFLGEAMLVADDGVHGRELWRSDGTSNGTYLLSDVRPGSLGSEIYSITRVGPLAYFTANDGVHGQELWVSDGTGIGTRLVIDLWPGAGSGYPESLCAFSGGVAFAGFDGLTTGLWMSDGTATGTRLLAIVQARSLSAHGDRLYFAGDDGVHGDELWVSDGTVAGTYLLKDIDPVVTSRGPLSSRPGEFVAFKGAVYFTAETSLLGGRDLWRTDGTQSGTALVADVDPGQATTPYALKPVGGILFFAAGPLFGGFHYLWKSDGSAAGTARVTTRAVEPKSLTELSDKVIFSARDPLQTELWISDGTDLGTRVLKDINPNGSSYPSFFQKVGARRVYFRANDGSRGNEVWSTDGSPLGTRLEMDLDPRPVSGVPPYSQGSSEPWSFHVLKTGLVCVANDGVYGEEMWRIDLAACATEIGDGCADRFPAPRLRGDDPVLGTSVAVMGAHAPVSGLGVVLLSIPISGLYLPYGTCQVFVDPSTVVALPGFAVSSADWSLGLTIPNLPSLTGGRIHVQTGYLVTTPVVRTETTNGLCWVLGS